MKNLIVSTLALAAVILSFQNCGKYTPDSFRQDLPKLFGTITGNPNNGGDMKLNFNVISEQVFVPHCVSCHGADRADEGIRYDSYSETIKNGDLNLLSHSYLKYQEPAAACDKISSENMDLVRTWIENGAPL